jgi:PDDEXK-like domain of unknown function (DUF3799)
MNNGIYTMSFADYQKADGVSKSMLDRLHPTPAHFRREVEETRPMVIGRMFHAFVLEQHRDYYVKPADVDFRTARGKAWKEEHTHFPIITPEEEEMLTQMCASVRYNPFAGIALAHAKTEQSVFVKDQHTGLQLKCRIDIVPMAKKFPQAIPLIDIKTCQSAAKADFAKEIHNRRYHAQAAYYLDCYNALNIDHRTSFIFIAVEKEPPYAVAIYDLDDISIEQGRKEYRRDLNVYKMCIESNTWPGYPTHAEMIQLPAYAIDKEAA